LITPGGSIAGRRRARPSHRQSLKGGRVAPSPDPDRLWLLLAGGLGPAAAEERLVPSWMTIDAGAKAVAMDVIAGFNPNNSNWNYNGYHDGDMTLVLPLDWSVASPSPTTTATCRTAWW
jgi:hypothetical protein